MRMFPGAQLSGRKKLSAPGGPHQHSSIPASPAPKGILHRLLLLLSLRFPGAWDQALLCNWSTQESKKLASLYSEGGAVPLPPPSFTHYFTLFQRSCEQNDKCTGQTHRVTLRLPSNQYCEPFSLGWGKGRVPPSHFPQEGVTFHPKLNPKPSTKCH